jgi:ABC-type Zn uptake system ZnuABC Zn-binding protein ZnuA
MFNRRTLLSLFVISGVGLAVFVAGCSDAKDPWGGKPTPHVLVSVPPLYSFAKSVAGSHGDVRSICTTTGPHGYGEHVSINDNALLGHATRFFTVGLKLDDQFADAMVSATDKGNIRVALGNKLPEAMKLKDSEGEADMHVWLGTPQAIAMVEMIRDELKAADPANKDDYDRNAAAYVTELEKLHDDGVQMLKDKKHRRLISFHESLGYFAKEFDIEIIDVIEDGPGVEPGAKKMLELVGRCAAEIKEHGRVVIAVEPQYPTSQSAAALKEALKKKGESYDHVVLIEIDPLETAEAKDLSADLYVKTMRKNLEELAKNLP